jgi:hypothetical protein
MTTALEQEPKDYRRCPDGRMHDLAYVRARGKPPGTAEYRCQRCPFEATKYALREETN